MQYNPVTVRVSETSEIPKLWTNMVLDTRGINTLCVLKLEGVAFISQVFQLTRVWCNEDKKMSLKELLWREIEFNRVAPSSRRGSYSQLH